MAIINTIIRGSGSKINNQDITITENGIYTNDDGYTGLGTVTVNVETTPKIMAYNNGVNIEQDKSVLISDGNLTLKTSEPLESENTIVSICDNGFCLTASTNNIIYNKFNNGIVGDIFETSTYEDILSNDYLYSLNGLKTIQYPMNNNKCIVTNSLYDGVPKSFVCFNDLNTTPLVKKIDYQVSNGEYIKSFADRFCYHAGNGVVYVYDTFVDNDYTIMDVDFNNIKMNILCYRKDNMDYLINYDSHSKWSINLNEFSPSCIQDGTIGINKIGLDICSIQQTKDEKYILCKNGYMTINDDNTEITEHKYPNIITHAMGGIGVHHFQALYDGYFGFGMEDGRYILCWYDTETETIDDVYVQIFDPYIIENDPTIYHRFFSGYVNYWVIPNITIGTYIASKTEIVKRKNTYTIIENNSDINKCNKNNIQGILTGLSNDDMYEIKLLLSEKNMSIMTNESSETIIVEGVE